MRKPCMRLLATALLLTMSGSVLADNYIHQVAHGNEAFRAGKYSEALDYYHAAETEIPESPELEYNMASTLHEQGAFEESVDRFTKALNTTDIMQEARAHYNLGNTHFRMEDYQKAIEHYQRTLEIDPDDIDAKYNLELARRKLKDQMKEQEQENEEQQEQPQEQQKQQQQPEEDQQEEEQQDQDQEQQQQQQQEQQEQEQQPQPQPQEDEKEMSREDAERILDALRDDEQEMQKQRKQVKLRGNYSGKDW